MEQPIVGGSMYCITHTGSGSSGRRYYRIREVANRDGGPPVFAGVPRVLSAVDMEDRIAAARKVLVWRHGPPPHEARVADTGQVISIDPVTDDQSDALDELERFNVPDVKPYIAALAAIKGGVWRAPGHSDGQQQEMLDGGLLIRRGPGLELTDLAECLLGEA